jgi:CBS domain-containing protein
VATEGTIPLADAVGLTVGEVMIREPKTLPAEASDYVDPNPLTVTPGLPISDAVKLLEGRGEPRLVVLDEDGVTLAGLLCVNATATGFCVR